MPPREMPSFEKSPAELVDRFDAVVGRLSARGDLSDVERRKMFGFPSLFVGGNLATGLHGPRWMVRLAPDDLETLLGLPGAGPFEPMPGRPMKGYGVLPPEVVVDDGALEPWLARSIAFVRTLPPKR